MGGTSPTPAPAAAVARARRRWLNWLGLALSLLFGYLAFRRFHWTTFAAALAHSKPEGFLVAVLCWTAAFALRAARWRLFLPRDLRVSFHVRWSGVVLGYFFSNFLPARLGDLIRPAYLARMGGCPFKISLYSVAVERVWDLVFILLGGLALLRWVSPQAGLALSLNLPLWIALTALGLLFLVYARRSMGWLAALLDRAGWARRLAEGLREVTTAFAGASRPTRWLASAGWTAVILLLEGQVIFWVLRALHLDIGFWSSYFVMFIATLSFLLPSAPAGLGVFHYFFQQGLMSFGVPADQALVGAVVYHACFVLFDTVCGAACLLWGPVPWRSLVAGLEPQPDGGKHRA